MAAEVKPPIIYWHYNQYLNPCCASKRHATSNENIRSPKSLVKLIVCHLGKHYADLVITDMQTDRATGGPVCDKMTAISNFYTGWTRAKRSMIFDLGGLAEDFEKPILVKMLNAVLDHDWYTPYAPYLDVHYYQEDAAEVIGLRIILRWIRDYEGPWIIYRIKINDETLRNVAFTSYFIKGNRRISGWSPSNYSQETSYEKKTK